MLFLGAHARKRWLFWGLSIGSVFLLSSFILILTFGPGGYSTARAAPPRQGDDPYQLCDLIRGVGFTVTGYQIVSDNHLMCVGEMETNYTDTGGGKLHYTMTVDLYQDAQYARMQAEGDSHMPDSTTTPGPRDTWTSVQIGDFAGEATFKWDDTLIDYYFSSSRGCYVTYLVGSTVYFSADTGVADKTHAWASQIDAQIMARGNTCPRSSGAAQPASGGPVTQPGGSGGQPSVPAEKQFAILGIGCSGATQETGKAGRVVCHVVTDNEPFDEPATFNWTLDNQPAGSGRRMTMDGIAEGEHTVAVTATFRGQVYTYTGWVTVSETGASTSAFNLSASCTYDEAKSTVTCRATPANPPANASLEYIWFWGGGIDASKTDTMTVSVPSYYRTYEVQVRCLDRTSSTYSAIASTSVVAGRPPVIPPALGQAINNALTGSPTPSKPDPAAVAGGAAAVGLGLGLVGLVNGLVNSAQQAATDAVKGIRSLPGVKAVEAAAKDVYIRNVAYAAAAGNKDAQALVGDQIQQVASDLGIPLPASLTGGETSATANKPVANPPPGGGAGQPESGSTGDKAPAQEPGWKAELEESGATYVPIFSEILESAAAEGNLKPAAPKSKDVTPLSPKEPKVTPDKIMDDVIKASEYDKAQERVKDLMAQWMENFSLPYEDRTIGPLERDNLRAEREKLEHQIQEEIKKRDDLLNPKKDKPE